MTPQLFVGNRNYSSWSLRAYLALAWSGLAFETTWVDLDQPGYGEGRIRDVLAVSPSGKVPALRVGGLTIWDSLAIGEWAAEQGTKPLWPADAGERALARAVAAEMHSGFAGLRAELSMNLHRRCRATGLSAAALADIARIDQLWSGLRNQFAARGPFLFGQRSLADAFYFPVATRFRTYGIALSPAAHAYCEGVLVDAAFLDWEAAALAEPKQGFSRANTDSLYTEAAQL